MLHQWRAEWTRARRLGTWPSEGGGCLNYESWVANPQLYLDVPAATVDASVVIVLTQADEKLHRGSEDSLRKPIGTLVQLQAGPGARGLVRGRSTPGSHLRGTARAVMPFDGAGHRGREPLAHPPRVDVSCQDAPRRGGPRKTSLRQTDGLGANAYWAGRL